MAKASTIASCLADLGLAGFTPGKNDFVAGLPELERFRTESKGSLLMANVAGQGVLPAWRGPQMREINGVKLGLIGVTSPDRAEGGAPAGLDVASPIDAVKADVATLRAQGARVLVVLAAVGRGEAKRIADAVPDLTAIVVGSPGGSGDANSETPPPERIGNVLIAETGNHLTTAAALDLYVRDGSYAFADGTGLDLARKRADVMRRIDEMRGKIAQWEGDPKVSKADIEARRADLAVLEKERAELDKAPTPAKGSFFRYRVQEMRDSLGKDNAVSARLLAYYKQVNEANKKAFADKKPKAAAKGEASYAGVETCTTCHDDARKVWDKTAHAHAYATLSNQFKEYNLDCVSCHVTGYDMPSGSTVTHVENLKDVQCEVCHGPGSKHAAAPSKVKVPIPRPKPESCLSCHHPPHVHEFDAVRKMEDILGPGHGR
ncbi:multiheme c-type cytochrome [Pendulispora albinea]|uniref:Cytochrome c-552/4 domain-containing protein n=1 Tax=Pendulispora albinea TaxID=2741071 RepID=A0ABZ2M5X9_9BACT